MKTLIGKKKVKGVIKIIAPTLYHKIKAWINKKLIKFDKNIQDKWENYAGGAYDNTEDSRTIQYSEIASEDDSLEIPKSFLLNNGYIQDQGPTNHCVGYGSTEGRNEGAKAIGSKTPDVLAPDTVAYIRNNLDDQIDKRGTWIFNGPKALQQMGKIYSYHQVNTIEQFKKNIYLGCTIQSGTNKLSWSKTGKRGVAVISSGGGHHMNFVGWDDNIVLNDGYGNTYTGGFIIENTWGKVWGREGRYYLPYELFDKVLFNTRLAMVVDRDLVAKRAINMIKNIDNKLDQIKKEGKENRYFHLIEDEINNGYEPMFEDLFEEGTLNAGEIKTLLEIYNIRKK